MKIIKKLVKKVISCYNVITLGLTEKSITKNVKTVEQKRMLN